VHIADVKLQEENVASPKTFVESRIEMEKILAEEHVGYLGLSKDGVPYVIPVTFGYVDGTILFHCSLEGKKLDYMRANPQVCFTVARQFGEMVPHPQGASCHADSDSVVCYGIARIAANAEERRKILNVFNRCLQPKARKITLDEVATCNAVEIKIAEMTGRIERDSKCTYWKQGISPD
jgi:nitroimidazol reductase NimA-like FMN-containing flavoprotein (pyridoxamine 5'-phosphate oxidase superfamily)